MEHFLRIVLLMAIFIVPMHFMGIDNKFPLMIGAIVGVFLAYGLGYYFLKRRNRKNN